MSSNSRARATLAPKVLSFGVALAVYLVVGLEQTVHDEFRYDVRIGELPEGYVLGSPLGTVEATLEGTQRAFQRLDPDTVQTVEIEQVSPDTTTYTLRPSNFTLPTGISVRDIVPSEIVVELIELVEIEVPVQPNIRGVPADGFVLGEIRLTPPTVMVRTPAGVWEEDSLFTVPIDIGGRSEGIDASFDVQVLHSSVHVPVNTRVRVQIPIEANTVARTFSGVPIEAHGTTTRTFELSQSSVALRVVGPVTTMEMMMEESLAAFVDVAVLAELGPGRHAVEPAMLGLPDGVEVVHMVPGEISVEIGGEAAKPPAAPDELEQDDAPRGEASNDALPDDE